MYIYIYIYTYMSVYVMIVKEPDRRTNRNYYTHAQTDVCIKRQTGHLDRRTY